MSAKPQVLVWALVTICTIAAAPVHGQVWTKLNDGKPVDAGE